MRTNRTLSKQNIYNEFTLKNDVKQIIKVSIFIKLYETSVLHQTDIGYISDKLNSDKIFESRKKHECKTDVLWFLVVV